MNDPFDCTGPDVAHLSAEIFQSLREEQRERQLQQPQDDQLADDPDHVDLTKLLERNKID